MEKQVIFFFVITFVNVVLSTTKSILTVKASKEVASVINAVAYGFYAMVVKQMATVSTGIVVGATVICNLVGVYFSMWLLDKFSQDVMWKISVVPVQANAAKIRQEMIKNKLGFNEYQMSTKYGKRTVFDIFSETSEESRIIKNILNKHGEVKYHIIELNKNL